MRYATMLLMLAFSISSSGGQEKTDTGPTNEKAKKTYKEALELQRRHMNEQALDCFKKADKQDDGHCVACQTKMINYGIELHDWKTAEIAASEMISRPKAKRHRDRSLSVWHPAADEGLDKHKDEFFERAHDEMTKALAVVPNLPKGDVRRWTSAGPFESGRRCQGAVRTVREDEAGNDPDRRRGAALHQQPELARAKMAPAFSITTTDGQQIAMDDLAGKVVLLDFWATWCAPCREALPHMREIAKKFQGQPLVVLSVSLDDDEQKWKDFLAKNQMTWPQYRDGGFGGPIARMFGVEAIPHTFTIDADGVLQDEHIGDAAIEGKLKKLIARAREVQRRRSRGTEQRRPAIDRE